MDIALDSPVRLQHPSPASVLNPPSSSLHVVQQSTAPSANTLPSPEEQDSSTTLTMAEPDQTLPVSSAVEEQVAMASPTANSSTLSPPARERPSIEEHTGAMSTVQEGTRIPDQSEVVVISPEPEDNVTGGQAFSEADPDRAELPSVSTQAVSAPPPTVPSETTALPAPPDGIPAPVTQDHTPAVPDEATEASPPPPPIVEPEIPDWVDIEEDLSVPDEEELKDIVGTQKDISALDANHHESLFYTDTGDPEQLPVKKLRLTWTIKGVRGTKEKPNYARVMNSPAASVDGFYWHVKFYPRGNNSSAISAYVKCSRKPPKTDKEVPESTFSFVSGPPDADLGTLEPEVDLSIPAKSSEAGGQMFKKDGETKPSGQSGEEDSHLQEEGPANASEEVESTAENDSQPGGEDGDDWRVPAQIGMVIYNPEEPRTGYYMMSCHQFNKHNDDWGWTNFHGPHNEIHKRRRGQRAALLRNDTIAIDAYIRTFQDPSQSLWWHPSPDSEKQWDSVSLAGYRAMGTPPLYHSPGVAGITAWLLLAPFRKIIQDVDTGAYRKDLDIRQQPLLCRLQIVLYLMRKQRKDENYVNVGPILELMTAQGETHTDVFTFWEAFRRSIELELNDPEAVQQISRIFDGGTKVHGPVLTISVDSASTVQDGLDKAFGTKPPKFHLPKFLPIALDRQKFDKSTREWKLLYNRVRLNDEIDLHHLSEKPEKAKYTLYGFMVHVGDRASGKFYSILRPDGPGTKWLAFEDGDGNKVFSYTRNRIKDFEGLEGNDLKDNRATRQTAYLAMYVRTDLLAEFLPGGLEPFHIPKWLREQIATPCNPDEDSVLDDGEERVCETVVQVYHSKNAMGQKGLLDLDTLKAHHIANKTVRQLAIPSITSLSELRYKLAKWYDIDNVERIRLFVMMPGALGESLGTLLLRPRLRSDIYAYNTFPLPLHVWMHVLETEEEVKLFGIPDPSPHDDPFKPAAESQTGSQNIHHEEHPAGGMEGIAEPATENAGHAETTAQSNVAADEAVLQAAVGSGAARETIDNGSLPARETARRSSPDPSTSPPPSSLSPTIQPITSDIDALHLVSTRASASTETMPFIDSEEIAAPYSPAAWSHAPVTTLQNENSEPVDHTIMSTVSAGNESPEHVQLGNRHELVGAIASEIAQPQAGQHVESTASADSEVPNSATTAEPVGREAPGTTSEDEALIAALISADLRAMEDNRTPPPTDIEMTDGAPLPDTTTATETTPPEDGEAARPESHPLAESGEDTRSETSSEDDEPARPVDHVFGFIQLFDAKNQTFTMHGNFLARDSANIKETVRKALGYSGDREFLIWRRDSSYKTSTINSSIPFEDMDDRSDGFVLVVGDVLSDSTKSSLLGNGDFIHPEALSRYLMMSARGHPTISFTGTKTIDDFGQPYYSGSFVKGCYNGASCHHISSTGHSYIGPFVASKFSGPNGRMTYPNGDTYTGSWKDGERDGEGEFLEKRTGNRYVGGYQGGKRWGKGVTYWEVGEEEGDMCQICYGEVQDALFYDCGHVCACVECARQVDNCPICRKSVKHVVKIYKA